MCLTWRPTVATSPHGHSIELKAAVQIRMRSLETNEIPLGKGGGGGRVLLKGGRGGETPTGLCTNNSPNQYKRGRGGLSRQVKFAAVSFAVGNFAEPLDFVYPPPPQSTVCTAGVREIHGGPGISRGKFHGQFGTRNFPHENKAPRNAPPPPCISFCKFHFFPR